MSESSSTIDVSSVTLSPDTARIDHRKWLIFFLELSHRLSTPEINLNNLQHTEAEWLLLHPIVDAAGEPIPPTPRLPDFPPPLAANASNAQGIINSRSYAVATESRKLAAQLKTALIASCGEDIAAGTADVFTGHVHVQYWEIFNYVKTHYGTLNEADISRVKGDILLYDPTKSFASNIARMRANFQALSSLGRFTSEVDKINALVEATSRAEVIPSLVTLYKIIHPAIADQTFQGLIAFITVQLPNATARATAYAASLVPTNSSRVLELEQALATANAIIATNAANAINATSNPRPPKSTAKANPGRGRGGGRGGPGRGTDGRGKSTTQRPYCFQHGYAYKDKEGHWGTTCNYMIENEYEERFLNARSPCTIDEYVGSTKNV